MKRMLLFGIEFAKKFNSGHVLYDVLNFESIAITSSYKITPIHKSLFIKQFIEGFFS